MARPGGPARRAGGAMRAAAKANLPNSSAKEISEVLQAASLRILPQVAGWLEAGAEADPIRAASVALQLAEFHVPKLSRSEVGLDDPTRQALDVESRRALLAQVLSSISPAPTPTAAQKA
jgi:hypothetical protein